MVIEVSRQFQRRDIIPLPNTIIIKNVLSAHVSIFGRDVTAEVVQREGNAQCQIPSHRMTEWWSVDVIFK
jgi:hypothetical protein